MHEPWITNVGRQWEVTRVNGGCHDLSSTATACLPMEGLPALVETV